MSKNTRSLILAVIAIGLIAIGELFITFFHPWSPRVVAAATAPDGTDIRVVQSSKGIDWWQFTFAAFRSPGGTWRWRLIDHEDYIWLSGSISLATNSNLVTIFCNGSPIRTIDWVEASGPDSHALSDLPGGWVPSD